MQILESNDEHIVTKEILGFEKDFEKFLGLIMEGTKQQYSFWDNIRSPQPD